jgi:hypothetical protein
MKPTFTSTRRSVHCFALCGFLLAAASPLMAATLTVTNLEDSGPGTLRQAIVDASPNDTIDFAVTGTITLTNGELVINNNLAIIGPGKSALTISASFNSRVFKVTGGVVSIFGLAIGNGLAPASAPGGAIYNAGILTLRGCDVSDSISFGNNGSDGGGIYTIGTLTIDSCVVRSNAASLGFGGAIYNAGTLELTHSLVANNDSDYGGGGIYQSNSGSSVITHSTITSNSAWAGSGGGGILNRHGVLTILNSVISYNETKGGHGDGAGAYEEGTLVISNSLITANLSRGEAGGIYIFSTNRVLIAQTTVSSCIASEGGAGIANHGAGPLIINNSTISSNVTTGGSAGGGIENFGGDVSIIASTITGNVSANVAGNGGGIFNAGLIRVLNCIIANNTAAAIGPDFRGTLTSQDFNLVRSTNGCAVTNLIAHNIYGQDPMLGPLQDNGGPTWTHALLPGSPAIATGHSGGLLTDQRGGVRPYVKPGNTNVLAGDGSDIGAFESGGYLWLTSVNKTNNDIRVQFTTDLGHDYQVERRDALDTSAWTSLPGLMPGTGGIVPFVETNAALLPKGFYRVRVD